MIPSLSKSQAHDVTYNDSSVNFTVSGEVPDVTSVVKLTTGGRIESSMDFVVVLLPR
jgi:hypothetical protein